ncbi:MAG: acyl carrier protein [Mycobacteriaceae bacterium]|uniref:acyl carrier protein n=1 Tax=Corynebacterium sp. TaxID=1720 RepID=UPI003F9AE510
MSVEISEEAQQKLAGKLADDAAADPATSTSARSARDARNPSVDTATRIAVIIEEATGVDVEEIDVDSNLTDDLHIDSVSRIDIAIRVEDAFHLRIEEEDIDAARTVKDLVRFVERRSPDHSGADE